MKIHVEKNIRIIGYILFISTLISFLPACVDSGNSTSSDSPKVIPSAKNEPAISPAKYTPSTYMGSDRVQKLIEGAKKEGKLYWQTSLAGPSVNVLANRFTELYPFVQVEINRADETKLVSIMAQEHKAGKTTVDVLEVTDAGALLLKEMELILPYYSPEAERLPEVFRSAAEGKLVWNASDRVSYISFGYNKNKVKEAPNNLEDLLKPEWKDKLGLVTSSTGTRWIGMVLHEMGTEKGTAFLKELSKQNIKVQGISGAAMMGLISQGEVSASPAVFKDHAGIEKDKGAPVEWMVVGPAVANVGKTLLAKNGPNPNASMLFIDFILSQEGQKVLHEYKYNTAMDKMPFTFWVPEEKLSTAKEYEKEYNAWKEILNNTFLNRK